MTNQTIGERIAQLRRKKNITQEAMAEQLGVTPQAVSKWENDISCPDITLLPPLAALLGVTVDELLGCEEKPAATLLPEERRKPLSEMIFRIYVNTHDGEPAHVAGAGGAADRGADAAGHRQRRRGRDEKYRPAAADRAGGTGRGRQAGRGGDCRRGYRRDCGGIT